MSALASVSTLDGRQAHVALLGSIRLHDGRQWIESAIPIGRRLFRTLPKTEPTKIDVCLGRDLGRPFPYQSHTELRELVAFPAACDIVRPCEPGMRGPGGSHHQSHVVHETHRIGTEHLQKTRLMGNLLISLGDTVGVYFDHFAEEGRHGPE